MPASRVPNTSVGVAADCTSEERLLAVSTSVRALRPARGTRASLPNCQGNDIGVLCRENVTVVLFRDNNAIAL